MDAFAMLNRGVSAGLRLGRGTADRGVRLARHYLAERRTPPSAPATFTPSPNPDVTSGGPNPASVARNIGPRRPVAAPATAARARPTSVPGAKLPPPRPSAS